MAEEVRIKILEIEDIPQILAIMKEPYMLERGDYYKEYFARCFQENINKDRVTFVAYVGDVVAGYVNLLFRSYYAYFQEKQIPEINDLYVVPANRRNGVGKQLLEACEKQAKECGFEFIGLGVGLYRDYGSAQRLYTKNGYILDGKGLIYNNKQVDPGTTAFVDDDLLLYLHKKL